ncbi:MAG: DUF433 domain-containing protein [Phycisphaeraceae bacterium]|nr:DUF433 domain-containing protein [Phycisphaeraceae bacterium]
MASPSRVPWRTRVTFEPDKMGGQACIRGLRLPVATVLRCFASGMSREEILSDYPKLEEADLDAALDYAADLAEDRVTTLRPTGS